MRPQTGLSVSALGEEFRSAREARSLSLSDVAERLHIRSVYLAAIEDEDWHVIGAPVYVAASCERTLDSWASIRRPPWRAFRRRSRPGRRRPLPPRGSGERRRKTVRREKQPLARGVLSIVVAVLVVLFVGYEFYQYKTGAPAGAPVAEGSAPRPPTAARRPRMQAPSPPTRWPRSPRSPEPGGGG